MTTLLNDATEKRRPVGRFYTSGSIGYELKYAEERKLADGGCAIVFGAPTGTM